MRSPLLPELNLKVVPDLKETSLREIDTLAKVHAEFIVRHKDGLKLIENFLLHKNFTQFETHLIDLVEASECRLLFGDDLPQIKPSQIIKKNFWQRIKLAVQIIIKRF
jgi:hypothetical protein